MGLDKSNKVFKRFKEKKIAPPTIGVAACFTDTYFSQQPKRDDLQGLVIGGQGLPYLDKILSDVIKRAVPDPWPVKGPWIKSLHDFWGQTWVPKLRLGEKIRLNVEHRIQLDEIEENEKAFVRGATGTGKTLIARETALRQAARGKRVLLLCFTDALSHWLAETISHPNITPAAIRHFAAQLLGENASEDLGVDPSEYWNTISLRAAIDGLPEKNSRWDYVIIDEGQDFSEEDWGLVF